MPISQSALNRGRRAAESDMRDTCVATFPTGGTTWDPVKLEDVPNVAELYRGRCELKATESVTVTADGVTVEGMILKIPTRHRLRVGAEIEITESNVDTDLVGVRLVVVKLAHGSHQMSRRYQVREVTGPGG